MTDYFIPYEHQVSDSTVRSVYDMPSIDDCLTDMLDVDSGSVEGEDFESLQGLLGEFFGRKQYTKYEWKRGRDRKERLVDLLGGKCLRCGYNKCYAALDFHHRERESKSFNLSSAIREFSDYLFERYVLAEIKKCDLLCANCHREEHWD